MRDASPSRPHHRALPRHAWQLSARRRAGASGGSIALLGRFVRARSLLGFAIVGCFDGVDPQAGLWAWAARRGQRARRQPGQRGNNEALAPRQDRLLIAPRGVVVVGDRHSSMLPYPAGPTHPHALGTSRRAPNELVNVKPSRTRARERARSTSTTARRGIRGPAISSGTPPRAAASVDLAGSPRAGEPVPVIASASVEAAQKKSCTPSIGPKPRPILPWSKGETSRSST
jgi:hypothetical protein